MGRTLNSYEMLRMFHESDTDVKFGLPFEIELQGADDAGDDPDVDTFGCIADKVTPEQNKPDLSVGDIGANSVR